jgi:ATP-binding cassette subfamily B protein
LVGTLIQLILPFLSQAMVDKGINGNNLQLIYLILIAQVLLTVGSVFSGFVRSWIFLYVGTKINISIISDFLIRVLNLPLSFFDTRSVGDLLQRIGDNSRIENFLTGSFLNILFSFVNLFIFGGILFYYNKAIFTIFFIGSTIYIIWVLLFQRIRKKLDYKIFDLNARNTGTLIQLFDGVQEIKLSNSEKQKRWDWEKLQASIYQSKKKMLTANQVQSSGSILINQIKNILISFLAAKAVIDGEITLGMMVAIQFVIAQANAPITEFVSFIRSYQMAVISFRRLNEIYAKKNNTETNENYITIMPENRDIFFNELSFSYSKKEDELIIKELNLHIPQEKTTAIVGESGSGKTTILKLLLKFYYPTKGVITIGGVNFNNVNPQWWNENCGAVLQDSYIFSDTIAKNICLGDEIIDKNKLIQATQLANIQKFIESLPFGYNTKIGKGGTGLSQGQKQRILLARIIYKNPEFVFLDEATNALDSQNEYEIMENMKDFLKGKTTIIIAHRLSTVRDADNIVVMDNGQIVEQGTHEELLQNQSKYFNLIQKQLK